MRNDNWETRKEQIITRQHNLLFLIFNFLFVNDFIYITI